MVKRLTIPATGLFLVVTLLIAIAFLLPAQAQAQAQPQVKQLIVEPDRTRLYEGEVLTLTVKGSMIIELNLGNPFDLDMSSRPEPDIEKVTSDFDILAQSHRYSIRTLNSEMVGEITWTYQLAPKTTGALTIPALTFKEAVSEPVTVNVLDGSPPGQATPARLSFIELATDKDDVYVQEQLILTVRLFFRGNLIGGELSEPIHPHAIIESLGKQQEFSRYRDGVRYRVVERRYAIFPQRPGTLKLPPIRFEGQARDESNNLRFLRDSESLFDLPVKDVPTEFSGRTWLPATGLAIEGSDLPSGRRVTAGETIPRTLKLTAAGLPAEALPPLSDAAPQGLRSYPEEPARQTETTPAGLTSSLTQSIDLVPVDAGTVTLPAIRIPWWDTEADQERVAVIPEQVLTVEATNAAVAETPKNDRSASDTQADADTAAAEPALGPASEGTGLWAWLSLVLAMLWAGTLLAWWWSRRKPAIAHTPASDGGEHAAFERLIGAAREGSAMTPERLVAWARLRLPERDFRSASDVVNCLANETLTAELGRLQARLFAPGQGGEPWDGSRLVRTLEQVRKQGPGRAGSQLPPLYPEGLA